MNEEHINATNPQTVTTKLVALAEHEDTEVRSRVAENPRIPMTLLSSLTWDSEPEVRASVAHNPNVSMAILRWLSHDESSDVRYSLAEDPTVPMCLLQELTNDANVFVAARAIQTIDNIRRSRSKMAPFQQATSKHQIVGSQSIDTDN